MTRRRGGAENRHTLDPSFNSKRDCDILFSGSPHSGQFPKCQILTIGGLLRGTEQARGEQRAGEQGSLFGAAETAERKGRHRTGK